MRAIKFLGPTFPFLLLFLGCSNPADNVAEATVGEANPSAMSAVPTSGGRQFAFGPGSSTIEWIGSKVTGHHDGGFHNFAGELTVLDGWLADSGNQVVIQMDSVWSDNHKLTAHLKNADFFEVEAHPTSTFISTSVRRASDGAVVTGNLTLRGVTREISFPADIVISEEEVRLAAEFFINRFDFNIRYSGRADDLIRREVILKLNVRASPGRADFDVIRQVAQATVPSLPAPPH